MKRKNERIVVTSGEFDPLTAQDIKLLKDCKKKSDWLIVGIHTDSFMELCRGGYTQNYNERRTIIESIDVVDEIMAFNDSDGTVCNLLKLVKYCYPGADITYMSDMDMHNMPETKIRGITFQTYK